jgi:hypothetical protein
VEPEKGIDLYRIFVDDHLVKSKNQGINKLRDLKKAHRDRVKELD